MLLHRAEKSNVASGKLSNVIVATAKLSNFVVVAAKNSSVVVASAENLMLLLRAEKTKCCSCFEQNCQMSLLRQQKT
jgi:hypothetical protein